MTIEGLPDCCTPYDPFTLIRKPGNSKRLWCPICGAEYIIDLKQVRPGATEWQLGNTEDET